MPKKGTRKGTPPGPTPDAIKIDGDWEAAVDKALQKERPKGGWPKDDTKRGKK